MQAGGTLGRLAIREYPANLPGATAATPSLAVGPPVNLRGWGVRELGQEAVAVNHCAGYVDQRFLFVARECSRKKAERGRLVDGVALHQYPLGAFGEGTTPESPFQIVVLGEAPEHDVDRALPVLRLGVCDVGEDAALGCLLDELGVRERAEGRLRAGGFLDDLFDQTKGVSESCA